MTVMRKLASTAALVFALALGAIVPRVALATPSLDACSGLLDAATAAAGVTVSTPGVWCLDEDVVSTANVGSSTFFMLGIDADDVTIDCRGHALRFQGQADTSYAILSLRSAARTTVRNCLLGGFSNAILLYGGEFLVEDNRVEASRVAGGGDGVAISAYDAGTIRRNRIFDAICRGISARLGSVVEDNLVDGVTDTVAFPGAYGIVVNAADGAELHGNVVRGLRSPQAGQAFGALVFTNAGAQPARIIDNVFAQDGLQGTTGVYCIGPGARLIDNVVSGYATLSSACIDAGDNDYTP